MRILTSRYAGKCAKCGISYKPGDTIYWNAQGSKGRKGIHISCRNQEIPESPKPESPTTGDSHVVSGDHPYRAFSIDWGDLKAKMQSVISGKPLKTNLESHSRMFSEYLNRDNRSWTGYSPEDVKRWLDRGYKLDGLSFENPPIPIREKRRFVFVEDDGDEFHIDRAYSGDDAIFSEWTKREVIPGLALEAEICLSAATSHTVLTSYFQFLCRSIYALEKTGLDLQVSLKMSVTGLYQKSPSIHSTLIKVKKENEATDFASWSAMLSPASLRAYGFCAMVLHADSENSQASSSLGSCNVPGLDDWDIRWNPARQVIEIIAKQHRATSFPAEAMEIKLREAIKAMQKGN